MASNGCWQYRNRNWSQLECINVDSTFVLCAGVCHTKHGEEKEEPRIVWGLKKQNCGNISAISRLQVNLVPLSSVHNIIKKFITHGSVANLSGRGWKRKIDERMQRRIVRMVDKQPQSTSIQVQAVLQTQDATVSARTMRRHLNEMKRYGRRPRRIPTSDTEA